MKNTTLSLILVLFVSACSPKTPKLAISAADMARPAEVVTNGSDLVAEHKVAKVVLMLSPQGSARLQMLAQEHLHKPVQILVGSQVLIRPVFDSAVSTGELDFGFATREEAQAVADLLNNR